MTRGDNLNGKHYEWGFIRLNITWVGTVLDGIFWIRIIRVGIILVGNFPGRNFSDRSYPGWEFSVWELSE